ncbi:glycosyltransferase family 2 protein [Carnobacterium gallinarum]|uniref:glycosyltransferase family 2 protein n=1 Tax=Carnobacterium gallinarum TaxID=2749 RepID=UPI0005526C4D|nr:glycosyltransferase family 2 protein [Carnobacterium gallinarum]
MLNLPIGIFKILWILLFVLSTITFGNLAFYSLLSIYGLKKPKRDYELKEDSRTFLFIIPAHNEEAVIENCLQSIEQLDYDSKKYASVVLSDNCEDRTAELSSNYRNTTVFYNTYKEAEPKGKPHVIGKYLNENTNYWQEFDYIVLIDADNLVSSNFLKEINSQFISAPESMVIQGYLDTKNISDSIISRGYAAAYFITNRAIQYSKHRLSWNTAIGGTGFAMATKYIKEKGWQPKSYTEDFEIQVALSIEGKKSSWNHFARVYDEKPNSINVSHVQRTRWSQGHWYIAFSKTYQLIKSFFKSENLVQLFNKVETLIYSYSMLRAIWLLLIVILIGVDARFIEKLPSLFSLFYFWIPFELLNYVILPLVYIFQEGEEYFLKLSYYGKIKELFLLWISFFFTTFIYNFAQIQGFFTWFFPQNNWKKTDHTRNINYDDLSEKVKKRGVPINKKD